MALAANSLPFGLRDVKVTPLDAAEVVGTAVDLPAARTFSFSETEDFEELKGDDVVQATHGDGPVIEWELEQGGISLAAYKVMAGGNIVISGVTPNIKHTFTKLGTDARPYFQVEGQAISDSGGDFHGRVYKAKATGALEGEMSEGAFWLTNASGIGIPRIDNAKLYDFVSNETAAAIA